MKKIVKTYTEIKLEGGKGLDKFYVDPLTKTYQYEHALLTIVSDLYSFSVRLDFGAKPKGQKPKKIIVI
ncbi:MAG: hypothetical protein IJ260_00540 [Butyrivibrio sp.]|nr:hypothetical protein [Butyrivibrio sp.]MBQ8030015.1 hypothetical protein [Butyrivibrio sp.]MBR1640709.1 hypothetical protein [Butyrivibrio sp.]MBR1643700.1 hypothetical protein [Butyrivibrio sp.]